MVLQRNSCTTFSNLRLRFRNLQLYLRGNNLSNADGRNNVNIKNFKIYNFYNGIYLEYSSNNNLTNNTANENNDYGIYLGYSSSNTLQGNRISYNNYGIRSYNSNTIINSNILCNNIESDLYSPDWLSSPGDNNTCNMPDGWNDNSTTGCKYGCPPVYCECKICRECMAKLNHPNCTVVNLTADITGRSGTCIDDIPNFNNKTFDCQRHTIEGTGGGYGIYLNNKENNTIINCIISKFMYGIYLYNSTNNNITNNTANQNIGYDSGIGIYLEQSNKNILKDNTADLNSVSSYSTGGGTPVGISLSQSSNNTLINNSANDNRYSGYSGDSGIGILLSYSPGNTLAGNTANDNYNGIYLLNNSNSNEILNNEILNIGNNGISIIAMINSYCICNTIICFCTDKEEGNTNNTISGNKISNNSIGIYSEISNSTINSNIVCGNINLDFNSSDWKSSSGVNNTCDKPDGWNDTGIAGCRYKCVQEEFDCDLNRDGIIIHDYNDLASAYKCFLGIKNCNKINYQNWNLMKREYECFTNNNQ